MAETPLSEELLAYLEREEDVDASSSGVIRDDDLRPPENWPGWALMGSDLNEGSVDADG